MGDLLKRTEGKRLKKEEKLRAKGELESDSECYKAESTGTLVYYKRPGRDNGNDDYKKAYNGSTSKRRRMTSSSNFDSDLLADSEYDQIEESTTKEEIYVSDSLPTIVEDQQLPTRRGRKRKIFP